MSNLDWASLTAAPRVRFSDLDPDAIPDAAGLYAWWRDGEPMYVDCARRLRVRLTQLDTHVAGTWTGASVLRGRVRLLLRESGRIDGYADDARAQLVDSWLSRCSVSWLPSPSFDQAEEAVLALLDERRPELHRWRPRYGEDQWLVSYLEGLGGPAVAGRVHTEVPIGGVARYGPGARTRFIDAVRLPRVQPGGIEYFHRTVFDDEVRDAEVELIEVKKTLNRTVIGQLIVARDLARVEWPSHGALRLVALCTTGDPALEWVCREHGIEVELVPPDPAAGTDVSTSEGAGELRPAIHRPEPDADAATRSLDGIDGAWERAELGRQQATTDETVALDDL